MKKNSLYFSLILFLLSCSGSSESNIKKGPDFGYHVDRIVRVNEGETAIGTFVAIDPDQNAINYSISNEEMAISQEGVVTFNIIPDFEEEDTYLAVITASNDLGSDEIDLTVYINDSDCELDTAAVFNGCFFKW